MTSDHLQLLIEQIEDMRGLVLLPQDSDPGWVIEELEAVWWAARAEANDAYVAWRSVSGAAAYAVYRAAEDRADAAQDVLALAVGERRPAAAAIGRG